MNNVSNQIDLDTGNATPRPTLFEQCQGFFNVPQIIIRNECCETGPTVYRPYPFADVITKAALSPQLFKDPECWSGRALNPRPPARESGTLPTELTGRRSRWSVQSSA